MWFEVLTGFREESPAQVRSNLSIEGNQLRSRVNDKTFVWGSLEIPSLSELRERVQTIADPTGKLSVREVVADVQDLHRDIANASSLFQVASQFNLLEMTSPERTPEHGVGIYEYDHTQGPACAISAGAGTIYRNYFVPVNGKIGQSMGNQIDCLSDLGAALGKPGGHLWEMRNGYALATRAGLVEIEKRLRGLSEKDREELRGLLRIGIQWNTQVTLNDSWHLVSQVYCSALPIAYSPYGPELWENFARLILEAAYEATLCAAFLNSIKNKNNHLFLTALGGGAFGNDPDWIVAAIRRALDLFQKSDLDIAIVSYGSPREFIRSLLTVK